MGGWAVAQSPILGTTITISQLTKRGYESSNAENFLFAENFRLDALSGN